MNIVFMGTPDFAEKSLKSLYDAGHNVLAVFTKPDKPKNRGHKLEMSPVKMLALEHETPVYQPDTMRNSDVIDVLKGLAPDVIVAVAYGKLLPKEILELPRLGCVNIHGSVLPKYRGSAPIQRSVLNGDETAGVTAMFMAEAMDAGDIINSISTAIGPEETSGELYDRLGYIGADLLVKTLKSIEDGSYTRTPQEESLVTYAPPLTKELSPIDWSKSFWEISCQVRGLTPWPSATAELCGIKFKVFAVTKASDKQSGNPGNVVSTGKNGIEVCCGDGTVYITQLQAPGGKRMNAADYLRGHPLCL